MFWRYSRCSEHWINIHLDGYFRNCCHRSLKACQIAEFLPFRRIKRKTVCFFSSLSLICFRFFLSILLFIPASSPISPSLPRPVVIIIATTLFLHAIAWQRMRRVPPQTLYVLLVSHGNSTSQAVTPSICYFVFVVIIVVVVFSSLSP